MAKFVIAGKFILLNNLLLCCNFMLFFYLGRCNCPYFAKAELVADQLVRNLPNFSVCKISKNANEWEVSVFNW